MGKLMCLSSLSLALALSACGEEIPLTEVDASGLPGAFGPAYERMDRAGLEPIGALVGEHEMPAIGTEDGPVIVSEFGKADTNLISKALFDDFLGDHVSDICGPLAISSNDQEARTAVRLAACDRGPPGGDA